MLIYQIKGPKVQHEPPTGPEAFVSKQAILERQLEKSFFKVGDWVKFKKPKKNPIYGTIIHIEDDHEKVTWTRGGLVPNNITIECEMGSKATREPRLKTCAKRLLFVAQKG